MFHVNLLSPYSRVRVTPNVVHTAFTGAEQTVSGDRTQRRVHGNCKHFCDLVYTRARLLIGQNREPLAIPRDSAEANWLLPVRTQLTERPKGHSNLLYSSLDKTSPCPCCLGQQTFQTQGSNTRLVYSTVTIPWKVASLLIFHYFANVHVNVT